MIRSAKREDGPKIVKLLMVILKDMELPFVKKYGEAETTKILLKAMEDPTYRYSYTRGIVKEINGEVAGLLFGYKSEDEPTIDDGWQRVLRRSGMDIEDCLYNGEETFPGEWYLDSISVDPAFRGKGIGAELIEAIPMLAEKEGKSLIGLSVDEVNPDAKRLYERMGFKVVGERMISNHRYEHMQKTI